MVRVGGDFSCTKEFLCELGEGDCDYDSECKEELNCGKNSCNSRLTYCILCFSEYRAIVVQEVLKK